MSPGRSVSFPSWQISVDELMPMGLMFHHTMRKVRNGASKRTVLFLFVAIVTGVQASKLDPLASGRARVESSIFAESALIDKETGRIFWESGGSGSTLSKAVLTKFGLGQHTKATVLSLLLLLGLLGQASTFFVTMPKNRLLYYVTIFIKYVCLFAPKFDHRLMLLIVVLYFWEASTCKTYQYLSNMMESHEEIEQHIEMLRQQPPILTWKVRSFHYEQSIWHRPAVLWRLLCDLMGQRRNQYQQIGHENDVTSVGEDSVDLSHFTFWPVSRKKVTTQSKATYQLTHWEDNTMVGLWQRAKSSFSFPKSHFFHGEAPFAKLSLTKLLVLSDATARKEYFTQQSEFLAEHSIEDDLAEFSTSIDVKGFKPRVLAVRPFGSFGKGNQKFALLFQFWLFTTVGFTVPFRMWFSNQCDEIRVSVVKESFAKAPSSSVASSGSWWQWPGLSSIKTEEESEQKEIFRQTMRQLALYKPDKKEDDAKGLIVPVKKAIKQIANKISNDDKTEERLLLPPAKNLNSSTMAVLEEMKDAIETAELLASNLTLQQNETATEEDPIGEVLSLNQTIVNPFSNLVSVLERGLLLIRNSNVTKPTNQPPPRHENIDP